MLNGLEELGGGVKEKERGEDVGEGDMAFTLSITYQHNQEDNGQYERKIQSTKDGK